MTDGLNDFERLAGGHIQALGVDTLQVNLGLRCNQACTHCHVQAGPERTELMDEATMELVLGAARALRPRLVDITGGAPELCPVLRPLLDGLFQAGLAAQVRTNLTVLLEPGQEDMFEFYRALKVALVASLPCYLEENVRAMRGSGVYERSVAALRRLNELGYGQVGSQGQGLTIDLVYNPGGAFLPPGQCALEADYRRELLARHGLVFNRLLTITNMPLGRFGEGLRRSGREAGYRELLRQSFNPATLDGLMCRRQINVGYDGALYDCDFNMVLGLRVNHAAPGHIRDFDADLLRGRLVMTGPHCLACTAGSGSSCGGALAEGTGPAGLQPI
ncbi:MAG: arsenosugar biosynthesis radical SAM protein ArsS [Proteobacteria bacterium]|nr:arsenosugar biosynthesis radical SAM protein ArsS [Pseudomonadota bacterium]